MPYNLTLIQGPEKQFTEKVVDHIYIFTHVLYRLRRWCKLNWGSERKDWNIVRDSDLFGFHAVNLQTRDVVEVR